MWMPIKSMLLKNTRPAFFNTEICLYAPAKMPQTTAKVPYRAAFTRPFCDFSCDVKILSEIVPIF